MKFATLFSTIALATSIAFISVAALPSFPLVARTPAPLTSHLHQHGTFYRAVTGGELDHVATLYKRGQHPGGFLPVPGDFSHTGALYVFQDIEEAKTWGSCFAKVQLNKARKKWYLITMTYTPRNLQTTSFLDQTPAWKTFVDSSYRKAGAHHDIVEGPVSVGHGAGMQAYVNPSGHMVWQAAFTSQAALATLVVSDISEHDEGAGNTRRCCPTCNIQ